jgi:hypothetical protein
MMKMLLRKIGRIKIKIEEVKPEEIINLVISSFCGISIGAEHYYAKLVDYNNCSESFELKRKITEVKEARWLSKKVGYKGAYKVGFVIECFATEDAVKKEARKQYKKFFPNAKVIILGRTGIAQPQPIFLGPRNFKKVVNDLYKRFDDIGQFSDPENDELAEKICAEWEKIWPIKWNAY